MQDYFYNPFDVQPPQPPVEPPQAQYVRQQPLQPQFYNDYQIEYIKHHQRVTKEKREIRKISLGMGIAIIAYLLVQNIVVVVLMLFGCEDLISGSENLVFTYGFTMVFVSLLSVAVPFGVVALVFKSMNMYKYPIIPNKRMPFSRLAAWVLFGMMCCIGAQVSVSLLMTFLESSFGITLKMPTYDDPTSILALIAEIVATAFVPAICEEFAMRCCSLQLLRKYGSGFAVFSVSVVFGLLHGNVVQFIFAFLIGVILGYVTIRTDSIVPAVLIHGLNNGISCTESALKYFFNEDVADVATAFIYIGYVALGIVALIFLFKWKEFKSEKKKEDTVLTFGQKLSAFLFPWMIVPFLILIALSATTISF